MKTRPMLPEWMAGLYGRRRRREGTSCNTFTFAPRFYITTFVRGTHTPHSAAWEWRIFYVWASTQGRRPGSFVTVYITLRGDRTLEREQYKQNNDAGTEGGSSSCRVLSGFVTVAVPVPVVPSPPVGYLPIQLPIASIGNLNTMTGPRLPGALWTTILILPPVSSPTVTLVRRYPE